MAWAKKYNILVSLSKIIPDGKLKNQMKCFYYNHFGVKGFKIGYNNNYFKAKIKDISFKSYIDPYNGLVTLKGFVDKYNIKPGDIVIDAGAHIGIFAIYASKIIRDGRIVCFEPDPQNFKKLMKNIELNSCENITVLKKGLWGKNTVMEFNSGLEGSSSLLLRKGEGKVITIPVVKAEDEIVKMGLDKVNFVKMDIEGAEIEAVKGFGNLLKARNINFAISSYHIIERQKTCFKLEKFFSEKGFNTETYGPTELMTYAWK